MGYKPSPSWVTPSQGKKYLKHYVWNNYNFRFVYDKKTNLVTLRCRRLSCRPFSRAWDRGHQGEGSPACRRNSWYCPYRTRRRRPLKTGRRPMSSQVTLLQRSGARWSSGRRTTWPSYERYGRRCVSGASCGRRRPWRRPSRGIQSKAKVDCDVRHRRGPGRRCCRPQ